MRINGKRPPSLDQLQFYVTHGNVKLYPDLYSFFLGECVAAERLGKLCLMPHTALEIYERQLHQKVDSLREARLEKRARSKVA